MLLLDMLTPANAAARHGDPPLLSPPRHHHHDPVSLPQHHHLDPVSASPRTPASSFLAQLPLSLLASHFRQQSPSPSSSDQPSHVHPLLPTSSTTTRQHSNPPSPPTTTTTTRQHSNPPSPQLHAMTHDNHLASFAPSRPTSSASNAADDRLKKKRAPRPKTSFLFAKPAHVPPIPHSRLYLRPKVLLQLHQVIAAQRPKPVYEVIPFSLLPPRSTRRFARSFNTRDRLGAHDLLVVQAEAYTTTTTTNYGDSKSEDERWDTRQVIGVISPARSDKGVTRKTEICMNDGRSRWQVSVMPNGSFEFNTTDQHGLPLKARWVLKPPHLPRSSAMSNAGPLSSDPPSRPEDSKYTFSTIGAGTRRHPVIATMTRLGIDVMDSYVMPSPTSPPTPGSLSPPLAPSSTDLSAMTHSPSTPLPIFTDDALRRFILVSAIWVAGNNYAPAETSGQSNLRPCPVFRQPTHRTVSLSGLDSPRSVSPASTVDEGRRSIHKLFRSGTGSLRRRTSLQVPSSPASTKTTTDTSPVANTRARRASSDAPVRSTTGSMRKRHGVAFEPRALPEGDEERQRSIDLLPTTALALPIPIERPSMESSPIETNPPSTLPTPSPALPDPERSRKTQSAYNPIRTTGLWDSGVPDRPGFRSRPTSMVVSNERKRKQDGKAKRDKVDVAQPDSVPRPYEDAEFMGLRRRGDWYRYKVKTRLRGWFGRAKV